jgi:adenylate cyclase
MRRLVILLCIAILTSAVSQWVVRALPGVHRLELLAYDWHSAALPTQPADDRIVIVGMDEESLSRLPLERPAYPLPRTIHAQLVRELHRAGARVIAFDVMFTRNIPEEDPGFAQAMAGHGRVWCALQPDVSFGQGEESVRFKPLAAALEPHCMGGAILAQQLFGKVRWFRPWIIDSETEAGQLHITFGIAASHMGHRGVPSIRDAFRLGPIEAPIGREGEVLIRFAGPGETFKPIPYHEVWSGEWEKRLGKDAFRDKAVLVGIIDPLVDRVATPLGAMQGVEVLAQGAQAVLQGNWLRPWSEAENSMAKLGLCVLLVLFVWKFGLRYAALAGVTLVGGWVIAAHQLFIHLGSWANIVEPAAALPVTFIAAATYETARVRRVFHRFMPSWVAEEMLKSNPGEQAGTVEREATVVFCDLRNSTKLAETLPSATVEALLRQFFVAGEEAAHRLGTELDKFVGDEIMLYFEDRPGYGDHAVRAIQWALAIVEAAEKITQSGLAGPLGFRVGVGVSTGVVRVGTVGAKQRIQHTVIGNAVNTASRLQTMSKEVNREIVVDGSTWQRAKERVEGERIGEVAVRGRTEPIQIYYPKRIL